MDWPQSQKPETPAENANSQESKFLLIICCIIAELFLYGFFKSFQENQDYGDNLGKNLNLGINLYVQPLSTSTVKDKIAVIEITGAIGHPILTEITTAKLRAATADPNTKAILLKIESPGGAVGPTDVLWNEVMKVRASSKPVVAFCNDICASGAYYLAAPANKIMISPTGITGSIGVYTEVGNFHGLAEKLGVKFIMVKSGSQKGALSPWQPVDQENLKILQSIINEAYERFVGVVASGRKISQTKVKELADGRPYTAKQALANGLVDKIGYFEDAVKLTQKLAGVKDATLVQIESRDSIMMDIFQKMKNDPLPILENLMPKPGIYYIDPTFY